MRRLTKAEKTAALAVLGVTVTAAAAGAALVRRYTRYLIDEAAARFDEKFGPGPEEEWDDWAEVDEAAEAEAAADEAAEEADEAADEAEEAADEAE